MALWIKQRVDELEPGLLASSAKGAVWASKDGTKAASSGDDGDADD